MYRRDSAAYLAEYHRFDADEHGWEREALKIVNAIGYWLGKDQSDAIPHVVAAGFLATEFERWDETRFATYRLKSLGRAGIEREIAAEMGEGWDDWAPVVYQATYLSSQLHEFAPSDDPALVEERIPYLRDTVVPAVFSEPLVGQQRELYSQAFMFGAGGGIFYRWERMMDLLEVPTEERLESWEFVPPSQDPLFDADLPTEVAGCSLDRTYTLVGYELKSKGPFGGGHVTHFLAERDHASIISVSKGGVTGARQLSVPIEKHVQALRELGFRQMSFPDGRHYEIGTWPGVKRID